MKNLPIEINYILKNFDVHLCGGAVARFILGRDTGVDYDYDIVALDRPTMTEVAKVLRDFEYVIAGDPGMEYQSEFSVEREVFRRGDTVVDLLGVSFAPMGPKFGNVTLVDWLASFDIDAAQVAWDRKAGVVVMTPEAALAYGRGEPRVVATNTRKTTPERLDKYRALFAAAKAR